ncbi:MAG: heavy metal translocating P-type ATPase [Bdellovibrionales bacterium]
MTLPSADMPGRLGHFVAADDKDGHVAYLLIEGMHCANCAFRIEGILNKEPGVEARVNLTTKRLTLRWEGSPDRADRLTALVEGPGYKLTPFDATKLETGDRNEENFLLRCLAVSGFASGNIMLLSVALWSSSGAVMGMATRDFMHWVSALIALPTVIYAGRPFFRSALRVLKKRHTNMDVPISVALVLTTLMSLFETIRHGEYAYFDSVTMLLFLLLIGRYLDMRMRGKARGAAQDLLMMMAGNATVIEKGAVRLVPIRELANGALLQVAAGEKIAADGVVESGASEVDPSFISGETLTQPIGVGTQVFGGMVNLLAPITVRITAASEHSLLGEIIKLMERAEQGHARYVRLADRIARYYTPVVHGLALITFVLWFFFLGKPWEPALLTAMTVLIITCPCALGLAVPAVQVIASSRLFRRGMLLKSADALERLAAADTIVFDKTGTLTIGQPRLVNGDGIDNRTMQLAASLAALSRHPLAQAVSAAYPRDIIALNVTEHAGTGLEAYYHGKQLRLGRRDWCGDPLGPSDEKPELWLSLEDEMPVRFVFEDALRSDAKATIQRLKGMGYTLSLLSGDHGSAVASVAQTLGIEDFRSHVTPVEKHHVIEQLKEQGRHVLMVGDGLNDAAALALADVSMSPSSALDITQNAADIVFQGDKLGPVVESLKIAGKAHRLVKENFILASTYNLIAIPVAMMGYVTPLAAAIAMAASSIAVVLNAQRLNRS